MLAQCNLIECRLNIFFTESLKALKIWSNTKCYRLLYLLTLISGLFERLKYTKIRQLYNDSWSKFQAQTKYNFTLPWRIQKVLIFIVENSRAVIKMFVNIGTVERNIFIFPSKAY
jgi:hypothetical protein